MNSRQLKLIRVLEKATERIQAGINEFSCCAVDTAEFALGTLWPNNFHVKGFFESLEPGLYGDDSAYYDIEDYKEAKELRILWLMFLRELAIQGDLTPDGLV